MKISSKLPVFMLFARLLLFSGVQALFALFFALAGSAQPWEAGANGWPLGVAISNILCLVILIPAFRAEGKNYWDLFRIERSHIKSDLLVLLGFLILTAPISYLPNVTLGTWLFGSPTASLELLVRPLPLWALIASTILFPITQGLAEIATYFGYVKPRLQAQGLRPWLALTLASILLSLQHIAVPLLFDLRFITWRALMFLPFAFLVGFAMHWRPRLLPYLAIVHALMNLSFMVMFFTGVG